MFRATLAASRILILVSAIWALETNNPIVTITGLGDVRGTTTVSFVNSKTIFSFFSVPYGKPPKDELRFKMPEAVDPWEGVVDGSVSGPACPQPKTFTSPFTPNGEGDAAVTSEDCLRLDIHTTQLTNEKKLPVLVFLHGGAFSIGGSNSIKPNFLLDRDIVLVVPQFRLGPLGFLSLDTEDIPGNAGLFDQSLALRWVRDHIADFGGDPDKVTLGGLSTGAASAMLHMFSPVSKGLFHRIIAHGGSGTAHWALTENPLTSAQKFSKAAGCDTEIKEDIAACLSGKSVEELMNAYSGEDGNLLMPAVQKAVNKNFIAENTFDLLTSMKYESVPIMAGFNKHEGLLYLEYLYNTWLKPNNLINNTDYLKNELVEYISSLYGVPDSSGVLVDALKKRFFEEDQLGDFNKMFDGLVDLCGASFVKGNVYRVMQFNSELNSCYLYTLNYYGKDHMIGHAPSEPQKDGVIHGDEMIYLFPIDGIELDEAQKKTSATIIEIWANFVTYGEPTRKGIKTEVVPEWPSFSKENDKYLIIDQEQTVIDSNFRKQLTISRDSGLITVRRK